jgi:hypothetical protein
MNYSFYLFSKLFDVIIGHEYECMVNFLRNNLDYIKNQEYLIDINKL